MDWDTALSDTSAPSSKAGDWDSILSEGSQQTPEPDKEKKQSENFYWNRFKRGVASGIGSIADLPARVADIGVMGYGLAKRATGTPASEIPSLPFNPNAATQAIQKGFGSPEAVPASGGGQAILGAMAEGAGAGLSGGLPMAGALNTAKTIPGAIAQYAATQGGIGAAAGGGAEIGEQAGGPVGGVVGGLIGGVVAPSSFLRYGGPMVGAGRAAYEAGKEIAQGNIAAKAGQSVGAAAEKAAPFVRRMVNRQLSQSVAGTPNAVQNIDDALALTGKIAGFKPSVAEMSGSRGAAQMQEKYALTSPERMNSEIARNAANKKAVEDYYLSIAPESANPSSVRSSVNQSVAGERGGALAAEQAVAGKVPQADQFQLGSKLSDLADAERLAAKPAVKAAYDKAFEASGDAAISAAPIVDKAEEILGTKLSQIKPENAPQTVSVIKRIFGDKTEELSGRSIDPELMAASGVEAKGATLKDLHDIRVAIGQDLAAAGRSNDPTAATRLFNLRKVMEPVDEAISQLPGADAYKAALEKYKTEYAPRFKEGTNLQVFKDKSTNEPRILPDRFVSEFFKPDSSAGITRSNQFSSLFGNNSEAKTLAKQGIMDIYRNAVVDPQTGVINQSAHAEFLKNYGRTLANFEGKGVSALSDIRKIGNEAVTAAAATDRIEEAVKRLKYDTSDELINAALKSPRVMGSVLLRIPKDTQPQFVRMVMDKATEGGTAASITKFLTENEKTLNMIPGMSATHKKNLQDIAKAYEIVERAPIKGTASSGGPDLLKNETGVSTATVQSQIRAWTGGRQALVTGVMNVTWPMLYKLSQTKFSDVMEEALHNPETARHLRDVLTSSNASQANMASAKVLASMKDMGRVVWSAKGPVLKHFIGAERYPRNIARSGVAIAATGQEDQ